MTSDYCTGKTTVKDTRQYFLRPGSAVNQKLASWDRNQNKGTSYIIWMFPGTEQARHFHLHHKYTQSLKPDHVLRSARAPPRQCSGGTFDSAPQTLHIQTFMVGQPHGGGENSFFRDVPTFYEKAAWSCSGLSHSALQVPDVPIWRMNS